MRRKLNLLVGVLLLLGFGRERVGWVNFSVGVISIWIFVWSKLFRVNLGVSGFEEVSFFNVAIFMIGVKGVWDKFPPLKEDGFKFDIGTSLSKFVFKVGVELIFELEVVVEVDVELVFVFEFNFPLLFRFEIELWTRLW